MASQNWSINGGGREGTKDLAEWELGVNLKGGMPMWLHMCCLIANLHTGKRM